MTKFALVEVKECVVYTKDKPKPNGKSIKGGTPVYTGLSFQFNDIHEELLPDEPVLERSATGELRPTRAHGTKVFFSYRFGTWSVTSPTMPVRYRSDSKVETKEGIKVVEKCEKNGRGHKDNAGATLAKFIERYPGIARLCVDGLFSAGLTMDKKANAAARRAG